MRDQAWRDRVVVMCREIAARYRASLFEADGVSLFVVPHADAYAILLHWPEHDYEVKVELDAEALAVRDEQSPEELHTMIEARIAYEVGRYFAERGATWRPTDG